MKNNSNKKPSFFKNFIHNYKTNEGYKAFVKLTLYFIFIFILILLMCILNVNEKTSTDSVTTTKAKTTTTKTVSVKEVLEKLSKNSQKYTITANINDEKYVIEVISKENILTGTLESQNELKKFKIEDNKIYELKMKENILNDKLFKDINTDYIIPTKLLDILLNNKIIKHEKQDYTLLDYQIDDTSIEVKIINNNIKEINIDGNNSSYMIQYE